MLPSVRPERARQAVHLAAFALIVSLAVVATAPGHIDGTLFPILLVCAVVSRLTTTNYSGTLYISGAFLCGALAAAFLGAGAAIVMPIAGEFVGWCFERYRPVALLINFAGAALPTVVVAALFQTLGVDRDGGTFYVALAAASFLLLLANTELMALLVSLLDDHPLPGSLKLPVHLLPTAAVNIALVTAIGAVYVEASEAVLVLVLVTALAFSYMTRLVLVAQERTKEYANLSWGVLSGLIRTLDARDHRAARHCAAVARFARDIATHEGMSTRDQELAHTAGLLHDIGRFALSDRVMERGITLTEEDWQAIRRHPELGAEMLRDIGVYGPLSEIIIAHHERIDGKGYPRRLSGDEIPEIAKIIAVAEVYDTLTAPDTYRTRLSSFEALTELRRVAGTQLDGRYIEALAALLAGQGTDYRHADLADYDEELAIERRMNEAAGR
jgi:putative nucleotidyltransferase with HDIG domain